MKLISYLSVIVLIFFLSSCEDLLVEEPKDFMSPESFFQSQDDAEAAIAGAYASSFLDDSYLNLVRHHSEYTIARGSFTSVGNYDQPINTDQFGRLDGAWSGYYTTINRSNVVISRVPDIENINPDVQARIIAEAHFLRAWSYWELLKGWGPVPLRLEEFTGASPVEAPRPSRAQVYDQILSDLLIAERDLPESVGDDTGRASRWAAKILAAQVYLDMEDWDSAAEKANEVIQQSDHSLVPVQEADDFSNLFHTPTASGEDIMSHHASVNRSYNHLNWYHGSGTPYNRGTVWGFTMLVDYDAPLISNWDEDDLRKDFSMYDSYVNEDGEIEETDEQNKWRFKKFVKDDSGNAVHTVPIWRLAEAYLIYAEASNMVEQGPTAPALEALNIVRRRGYGFDPFSPSQIDIPSGLSQNEFHERVIQERAYELFFENDSRWWDLRRTDTIHEVFEEAGKPYSDVRLLWPLPQQEIDNNPAIDQSDQNPGY
jgi:starch-binding outer membrane protein, SusD/RagB family